MVGSPNFVRFVYDGDGSAFGVDGPSGSGRIEYVFVDYFASQGLATEPTEFDGRSDYDAFINAGIPAGGLFTGAEGIKTAAQAAIYGGTAGVAYDPCYHQACDTIANLSGTALDQMSDAIAHSTLVFAHDEVVRERHGQGLEHGQGQDAVQGLEARALGELRPREPKGRRKPALPRSAPELQLVPGRHGRELEERAAAVGLAVVEVAGLGRRRRPRGGSPSRGGRARRCGR